jgi:hypothetical protein
MPSNLNSGFSNNKNVVTVRASATASQKLTDRSIDLDGDGEKEQISVVHVSGHAVGTPSAPGGKKIDTVTTPNGFKNTEMETVVESDGGVTTNNSVSEFTEGLD